jgi:Cu(I)/Ag(I) efflux system membrane fusion protein/cobalt-zinc-cadmium efflux system membrane fusion protein
VILAGVILAILYGTGGIFFHPKVKKEAICWVSPQNPDYIQYKPGKDPEGNELVPVYPKEATTTAPAPPKEGRKVKYWVSPMDPKFISDKPGKDPMGMNLVPVYEEAAPPPAAAAAPKKERKVKYWVDPMDPRNVSDHPGKAPCGMDMVPVYEEVGEAAGGPGTIAVSPTTIQSMGVRTAKVEVRPLSRVTLAVGRVNYNERNLSVINTKINGWVERLYVNATGDSIRRGQTLLSLYSPELVTAQREYLLALKNLKTLGKSPFPELKESAQRLAQASRQRLAYWDITAAQISELERTGEVKKHLTLTSPANGIVTKRMVTQGMYVQAGMPLLEVADLSTIWVDAEIYQYELPWIKVGQKVEMTLQYMPGETFSGTIDFIYPYLKEATRTAKVRLRFPNPQLKLKPEMFAQVKIQSPVTHQAVVVPSEAVLDTGVKQHVFLALGQGRFEPREVKLGVEGNDGLREVLEGLKGGEDVVISAQFLLDSESRFREAVQMMMPGMKMEGTEGAPSKPTSPSMPGMPGMEGAKPAPAPPPAPATPVMPPGHKH